MLLFLVLRAAPSDSHRFLRLGLDPAAQTQQADTTAQESVAAYRQYFHWLSEAATGNFGISRALQKGRPASELLWPSARHSFGLVTAGLILSALMALGAAIFRLLRPHSILFRLSSVVIGFLSAIPVFLYVYMAVAGGNRAISWGAGNGYWMLPSWFPLPMEAALIPWLFAALFLAIGDGGLVDLYQRFTSELGHACSGEHMTGVRVGGLSVPGVIARGFIPGALSHMARRISFFLGSVVVLEAALGWPGIGYLAWRAAAERDMAVLLGAALIMSVALRLILMGVKAVSFVADPRRRVAK
jgi:peptide/nickel transport system permease protein